MSSKIDELEVRSQIRVGERPGALQVERQSLIELRLSRVGVSVILLSLMGVLR